MERVPGQPAICIPPYKDEKSKPCTVNYVGETSRHFIVKAESMRALKKTLLYTNTPVKLDINLSLSISLIHHSVTRHNFKSEKYKNRFL